MQARKQQMKFMHKQAKMASVNDLEGFEALAEVKKCCPYNCYSSRIRPERFRNWRSEKLCFWAYSESTNINTVKLDDQNNRIVVAMLTNITEEGTQKPRRCSVSGRVCRKARKEC